LTGLRNNTVYYYVCGSEEGGFSSERQFRTGSNDDMIVFVACGDSQDQSAITDEMSRRISTFNPDFVLHLGDIVYDSLPPSQSWYRWFTSVDALMISPDEIMIQRPELTDGGSGRHSKLTLLMALNLGKLLKRGMIKK